MTGSKASIPALVYSGVLHVVAIAAVACLLGTGHLDGTVAAGLLGGLLGTGVGSGLTLLPGAVQATSAPPPVPSPAAAATPATPTVAAGPVGVGSVGTTTPAGPAG